MLEAEFRAIFDKQRSGENLFALMARYAAKAAEGLLGSCFDPEPVKLPKLEIATNGLSVFLVAVGPGGKGSPSVALGAEELAEVIRRVEAVDKALEILEEPWGQGEEALDMVFRAAEALRGAPSKPEPAREPERIVVPEVGWIWIAKDPSISGDKRALTEREAKRGAEILNGYEAARDAALRAMEMNALPLLQKIRGFFQVEEGGE
jgi:hypothetical protein